jgi:hypothetical protein
MAKKTKDERAPSDTHPIEHHTHQHMRADGAPLQALQVGSCQE